MVLTRQHGDEELFWKGQKLDVITGTYFTVVDFSVHCFSVHCFHVVTTKQYKINTFYKSKYVLYQEFSFLYCDRIPMCLCRSAVNRG
jgi:hypothetical protein